MDSTLGDEIMIEILSRTSVKALGAMRCTSKKFEKLTYDSHLLDLFKKRNATIHGFLVVVDDMNINPFNSSLYNINTPFNESDNSPDLGFNSFYNDTPIYETDKSLDLGFLPHGARTLAISEHGMMVFESPHSKFNEDSLFYICKPATKQVLVLPNPKTKYLTLKVVIMELSLKPLCYKILRLSHPGIDLVEEGHQLYSVYRCEIFDSKTWAWRELELVMWPYHAYLLNTPPIATEDSIYMLLRDNGILKFDVYSEKCSNVSLPIPIFDDDYTLVYLVQLQLVKHEGKLGVAYLWPNGCLDIWVIGVHGLWERVYDMKRKEVTEAWKSINLSQQFPFHTVFPYQSDLVPINLRGKEKFQTLDR